MGDVSPIAIPSFETPYSGVPLIFKSSQNPAAKKFTLPTFTPRITFDPGMSQPNPADFVLMSRQNPGSDPGMAPSHSAWWKNPAVLGGAALAAFLILKPMLSRGKR